MKSFLENKGIPFSFRHITQVTSEPELYQGTNFQLLELFISAEMDLQAFRKQTY